MDFFQYVNIFETKGIEYLLVIAFMLCMVVFIRAIARKKPRVSAAVDPLTLPDGHFLGSNHLSAQLEGDGSLLLFLGGLPRHLLGPIEHIELRSPGPVDAGEVLATVQAGKRQLRLRAWTTGVIESHNPLFADSAAVGATCSHSGWLLRFVPHNLGQALSHLRFAGEARAWLHAQTMHIADLLIASEGTADGRTLMADGGLPVAGAAHHVNDAGWEALQSLLSEQPGERP